MFEKVLKTSHFCPRVFEWNVTGAYLPNAPTINNDYLHEEKKLSTTILSFQGSQKGETW
jgi:hypothetical protein